MEVAIGSHDCKNTPCSKRLIIDTQKSVCTTTTRARNELPWGTSWHRWWSDASGQLKQEPCKIDMVTKQLFLEQLYSRSVGLVARKTLQKRNCLSLLTARCIITCTCYKIDCCGDIWQNMSKRVLVLILLKVAAALEWRFKLHKANGCMQLPPHPVVPVVPELVFCS